MKEQTIKKIIEYFKENEETFNACIEELDAYNGYGNLVSTDYKDYSAHLDEYAIEEMSENRCYIDTIESDSELSSLFDELEQEGDGE